MKQSVGIIGGGQLAAFLCGAARKLGISTVVLGSSPDDVAAKAADTFIVGSAGSMSAARTLTRSVDVITFDKEDIPASVLETLTGAESRGEVRIAPGVQTLIRLQNKAVQKNWLLEHGFDTVEFQTIENVPSSTARNIGLKKQIVAQLGSPFVMKTQRGGYDGLGVQIVHEEDLLPFSDAAALVERFVPDRREFAVLSARSAAGEQATYDPFELVFDQAGNLLRHVTAPTTLPRRMCRQARDIAQRIVSSLDGVGLFAVEFFLAGDRWLVNEIAPRVHNSGHLTLEAHETSQFDQHIRAICDLPLGPVRQKSPAAMINLLCESGMPGPGTPPEPPEQIETRLHWYGKRERRPLRKLGHITATGPSVSRALSSASRYRRRLRRVNAS